jgi:hypothetical protein
LAHGGCIERRSFLYFNAAVAFVCDSQLTSQILNSHQFSIAGRAVPQMKPGPDQPLQVLSIGFRKTKI